MNPIIGELIAQILKLVGPWLTDAIKKWLDGLFTKAAAVQPLAQTAAADTPELTTADKATIARDLIEDALRLVKGIKPFKRATLHVMARVVPAAIARGDKKLKKADGGAEIEAVGWNATDE
jgi:hypothetical protein